MEKYIVYSIWFHDKGLRPAEEMRDGMRKNVKPHSPAEDVICGRWTIIIINLLRSTLLRCS